VLGPVLDQRLGHLRAGGVAGAQEQHTRPVRPWSTCWLDRQALEADRWVQGSSRGSQQLSTTADVDAVVGVAPISRAVPGRHQAHCAQLTQVIRDETLGLANQLAEVADTSVAASELAQQSPTQRIGDELEEVKRRHLGLTVDHEDDNRPG
jgi:hypothetical protein